MPRVQERMEKNLQDAELELTIISARDLRIERRLIEKNTFTLVTVGTHSTFMGSTSLSSHGGSNPSWNETLLLSLPHGTESIIIEVVGRQVGSMIGKIATVSIQVSDFCSAYFPPSFLLKDHKGEPNGIIDLFVRGNCVDHLQIPMSISGADKISDGDTMVWDVTIISARDLRINRHLIKKDADTFTMVTVRSDSSNSISTSLNTDAGSNPSWNEKFQLSLPHGIKFVTLEVVQHKIGSIMHTIGTASISVSNFIGTYFPQDYLLKDRKGKHTGILSLYVRPIPLSTPAGTQTTGYGSFSSYRVKQSNVSNKVAIF